MLEFFTLVLTTGVVTTLMHIAYDEYKERRQAGHNKKLAAGHLAIQVAVRLEAFLEACSSTVADINFARDSKGVSAATLPKLVEFPTDLEAWRVMTPRLVHRCLSLPNEIVSSEEHIGFNSNVDPGDDGDGVLEEEAIRLGLLAAQLAAELRSEYEWPQYEPRFESKKYLMDRKAILDQNAADRQARDARLQEVAERARLKAFERQELEGSDGLVGPQEPSIVTLMRVSRGRGEPPATPDEDT